MKNEIIQNIKTRRSIFPAQYTGGELPEEDLNTILESARWAPTHKKSQPWRFKVLTGKALTDLGTFMGDQFTKNTGKPLSFKVNKLQQKLETTAAVLLIFMHRDEKESIPEWEEIAAVSMSVQNMWLTTHSLGHGAYWSSPKTFAAMQEFKSITVNDREKFLGFFYIGTIDHNDIAQEQPQRLAVTDFTQFIGE